jgi:hypothetical protein
MSTVVVLDSGPLGLIIHPHAGALNRRCLRWMQSLLEDGADVVIPEIGDYETRRVLLRIQSSRSVEFLDELIETLRYEPLTTTAMRRAAHLCANARRQGTATADDVRLDIDVILAAQTEHLAAPGDRVVIATTNVAHLSRFVAAELWETVRP